MSMIRGIEGKRTSTSKTPIYSASSFPIALVLTSAVAGLYYFDSPRKALAFFKNDARFKGGNWERYLTLFESNFQTTVPIVISIAENDEDANNLKSNIIEATNRLKNVQKEFDVNPDIVAVADLSADADLAVQLGVVNEYLKSRSFYDIDAHDASTANLFRGKLSSDRISIVNTPFENYNTDTKANEFYDGGVVLAMQRAYLDGKEGAGWFASLSNRPVAMTSAKNIADHHDGADEADAYSQNQVWCVVRNGGLRPWGSDYTCSTDPIWQDGSRVRLVDVAIRQIRLALRDNIDKDLGELSVAKSSLDAYVRELVSRSILLGGELEIDEENSNVDLGEFAFIINFQEMPKARKITITLNRTSDYSQLAYKILEAA